MYLYIYIYICRSEVSPLDEAAASPDNIDPVATSSILYDNVLTVRT